MKSLYLWETSVQRPYLAYTNWFFVACRANGPKMCKLLSISFCSTWWDLIFPQVVYFIFYFKKSKCLPSIDDYVYFVYIILYVQFIHPPNTVQVYKRYYNIFNFPVYVSIYGLCRGSESMRRSTIDIRNSYNTSINVKSYIFPAKKSIDMQHGVSNLSRVVDKKVLESLMCRKMYSHVKKGCRCKKNVPVWQFSDFNI